MKNILLFLSVMSCTVLFGQTLIWSDDFETTSANWDINTVPIGGINDVNSNLWKISDEEGGVTPPGCGVANNGNKTLHVTCQGAACTGTGAIYFAGDGGFGFGSSTTDKRTSLNTAISTIGETQLELSFDWIGVGQAGADFAVLEYSTNGGTVWNVLWTQTPGNVCGTGQGQWKLETVSLPLAAENIADLRFAFRWKNDNDAQGVDPSFAVDNLRLNSDVVVNPGAITAAFTTPSNTICAGDCIGFTDASTGNGISTWYWTFDGANVQTSTDQNPINICFPTPGTYNVTLSVSDGGTETDYITSQITVNDCSSANTVADFTASSSTICEGDCISFTDISTGDNLTAWNWTFEGANVQTSTDQNPSNICFSAVGTYNVNLSVTGDGGVDNVTHQINVQSCSAPPVAAFSVDTTVICAGDCVSFIDLSTGNPTEWTWLFEGGKPQYSIKQNPSQICFNTPGTFDVTLTVSNDLGTDQIINTIVVLNLPSVAAVGDTTIEMNGTASLVAIPISSGTIFWTPEDDLDCAVCPKVSASPILTTIYTASIVDANGCIGKDSVTVKVNFKEIIGVPSAFSPNNDGNNDEVFVLGVGIRSINFKIYNKYGQLVFSTTDITEGWDGKMNGKLLNQGVFVYTLDFELIDGSRGKKSGNITLIK